MIFYNFLVFHKHLEKLLNGLIKYFNICDNMIIIIHLFVLIVTITILSALFCATTETRQQIKLANKNNNCKTKQLHNLFCRNALWESVSSYTKS